MTRVPPPATRPAPRPPTPTAASAARRSVTGRARRASALAARGGWRRTRPGPPDLALTTLSSQRGGGVLRAGGRGRYMHIQAAATPILHCDQEPTQQGVFFSSAWEQKAMSEQRAASSRRQWVASGSTLALGSAARGGQASQAESSATCVARNVQQPFTP